MRFVVVASTALFVAAVSSTWAALHWTELVLEAARDRWSRGTVTLLPAPAPYLGRAHVAVAGTHVETGALRLGDGHTVWWWFLSQHEGSERGGTVFEFDDGSVVFVEGWFCCEVRFDDVTVLESSVAMKAALAR